MRELRPLAYFLRSSRPTAHVLRELQGKLYDLRSDRTASFTCLLLGVERKGLDDLLRLFSLPCCLLMS